jgi:parallel beta-helix repeat protein
MCLGTYGTGNSVSGCAFYGNAKTSVYGWIANGAGNSVTGSNFSYFTATGAFAIISGGNNLSIVGNTFTNAINAISLNGGSNCAIVGNSIFADTGTTSGIALSSGSNNLVSGNTLSGVTSGILITGTNYCANYYTVTDNSITGGATGIILYAVTTGSPAPPANVYGLIANNHLRGQSSAAINDLADPTYQKHVVLRGNVGMPNYRIGEATKSAIDVSATDAMCSQVIVITADSKKVTLPTPVVGARYRIVGSVADTYQGLTVAVDAVGQTITMDGNTTASGKGKVNTRGTHRAGDYLDLIAVSTTSWVVVDSAGIWADES